MTESHRPQCLRYSLCTALPVQMRVSGRQSCEEGVAVERTCRQLIRAYSSVPVASAQWPESAVPRLSRCSCDDGDSFFCGSTL